MLYNNYYILYIYIYIYINALVFSIIDYFGSLFNGTNSTDIKKSRQDYLRFYTTYL